MAIIHVPQKTIHVEDISESPPPPSAPDDDQVDSQQFQKESDDVSISQANKHLPSHAPTKLPSDHSSVPTNGTMPKFAPVGGNSIFASPDDTGVRQPPTVGVTAPSGGGAAPGADNEQRLYSSDSDGHHSDGMPEPEPMEDHPVRETEPISLNPPKRKKIDLKDVFNQDDEDIPVKKRRLPLPGKDRLSGVAKEKVGEDKRKNIKSLIDRIPTTKEELFSYPIDSSMVDNVRWLIVILNWFIN